MVYKYVYVKTFNVDTLDDECNEFHFRDVKIESTDSFLTIYDKDGVLEFRCLINNIAEFIREK